MTQTDAAISYARAHRDAFLEDLKGILRIPSISTLPEYEPDMRRAAEWLVDRLKGLGFDRVDVLPTKRHPVVYGEYLKAGADAPTILVYGHYDVQPVDPLDLWKSDPFDPRVRGDNLYARGASDMKGQMIAHIKAVESLVRTTGLPVNLKYMIEGEEEIGSPSLADFIVEHEELLAADVCLNTDAGILAPDVPSIAYALRGLAYFEIRVQGPRGDLHSGVFGGAVDNPAQVLCELVAGMRDEHGRVTWPGFYDHVRPLTEEERAELAKLPQQEDWWLEQTGAPALRGEEGYTALERATARPTLDVNGLLSGFTGEGAKTVLPAKAMVKISTRLVPDQRPEQVYESLRAYLEQHVPPTVTWELEYIAGCLPSVLARDSRAVQAASQALQAVWGKPPLLTRQGGSVPVVGIIKDKLGVDSLLLGFGLPDDNLHAPNEKLHLPNFFRGIETYIRFMREIASLWA
ncbi:MAG: dipeptidase [Anaerolineae bacterium]|nr:dipeptidase [Anaerolineae bacterium]